MKFIRYLLYFQERKVTALLMFLFIILIILSVMIGYSSGANSCRIC